MFDKNSYYRKYMREYYADPVNRARRNMQAKIRRRENPQKYLWHKAKERATKTGLPFDIEEADIIIPERCPILGILLAPNDGTVKRNSPVLDRKDNTKGYVKGNIQVVSQRGNQLKSDLSIEDAKRLILYMEGKL